jgi:predicted lipid-binding transport protein (Tim44 family)
MSRFNGVLAFAAVLATLMAGIAGADARPGFGGSFGSRGTRTFSPPPITRTAPNPAGPMERSMTQPARPTPGLAPTPVTRPGFFNRPGFFGGLLTGFLGAGLLGLLFGNGLFGGMAGFAGIIGLLLQIGLIVIVGRLIFAWWQRRNGFAMAGGPSLHDAQGLTRANLGGGAGPAGPPAVPVPITPADYDSFERLLHDVTLAYGSADLGRLRGMLTPEMFSYMADDLGGYASRGLVNETSDVALLQGDLAEAWREGDSDYATVAMRYRVKDALVDRASGHIVEGSREPQEVTELWTFGRARGGDWLLSAIQQAH